jgi:hypothetical protein
MALGNVTLVVGSSPRTRNTRWPHIPVAVPSCTEASPGRRFWLARARKVARVTGMKQAQ